MAFDNQAFPIELAALDAMDQWGNTVVVLGGGSEQRNVGWSDSRRIYDCQTAENISLSTLKTIRNHFNARRGSGRAFPLRDRDLWKITAQTSFGTGTGAQTIFQLAIDEGDAANSYIREIYLPESGTLAVFDNGSPKTEGVDFTVAYSGSNAGKVTFTVAPLAGHALTWTGQFWIPVRYSTQQFPSAQTFIWNADNTGLVKGPRLSLIEVRYTDEF